MNRLGVSHVLLMIYIEHPAAILQSPFLSFVSFFSSQLQDKAATFNQRKLLYHGLHWDYHEGGRGNQQRDATHCWYDYEEWNHQGRSIAMLVRSFSWAKLHLLVTQFLSYRRNEQIANLIYGGLQKSSYTVKIIFEKAIELPFRLRLNRYSDAKRYQSNRISLNMAGACTNGTFYLWSESTAPPDVVLPYGRLCTVYRKFQFYRVTMMSIVLDMYPHTNIERVWSGW